MKRMRVAQDAQNFDNHGRVVVEYHYGVFVPLMVNFVWWAYAAVTARDLFSLVGLLTSVGLLLMFVSLRRQVLTVQDRIIRLEMRLRLRDVLPPDLHHAIAGLTVRQLVALRFASDAELPALVREIASGRLGSAKDIKRQVRDWQGDYLRA